MGIYRNITDWTTATTLTLDRYTDEVQITSANPVGNILILPPVNDASSIINKPAGTTVWINDQGGFLGTSGITIQPTEATGVTINGSSSPIAWATLADVSYATYQGDGIWIVFTTEPLSNPSDGLTSNEAIAYAIALG